MSKNRKTVQAPCEFGPPEADNSHDVILHQPSTTLDSNLSLPSIDQSINHSLINPTNQLTNLPTRKQKRINKDKEKMSSILSRSLRACTSTALPKTGIAPRPAFLAPRLSQHGLRQGLRQGTPGGSLGMGVRFLSEQPRLRLGSIGMSLFKLPMPIT